jgi:hypothetical protein
VTLQSYADEQARETRRTLLDVETRAHAALKATAAHARPDGDPVAASRDAAARIAPVIVAARQAARRAGGQRMQDEVTATARGQRIVLAHDDHKRTAAADRLAAERASRDYGDAMLRVAMRDLDGGAPLSGELDRTLEGISVDQAGIAFNDERRRLERAAKREHGDTQWFPLLFKMWDATLDRRTCPRCSGLDNKKRPWGVDFAGHLETPAHKRCRCVTVYVGSPLYMGRESDNSA